ncbi:cytochrome c oxidase subunit 3 [Nocardia gamkensis]|uniref:cytochrome c oxidase subunit 3 n=1 Tax=Nocardia gamkensis TaxID=352869 RepID=UPI0037C9E30B
MFIGADLALFTLLFASFLSARADDPILFEHGRETLDPNRGGINTLLLLTSSWCVVRATRAHSPRRARRWILAGLLGGLLFAVSKIWEYAIELAGDHTPAGGGFYLYYYSMTGLHFLHVTVGCVLLLFIWIRWRRRDASLTPGVESVACYWHMVDLLWVLLFPLLYLLH